MTEPVAAPVPRKLNAPVLQDMELESTEDSISPVESLGLLLSPLRQLDLNLPSLLDELLSDCFQFSIDSKGLCESRRTYVEKFHKFILDRHTYENLAFLIEIFRYEYFYDKIHPEHSELHRAHCSSSHLPLSLLNDLLHHFVDNLPYPTSSMQRKVHKVSSPLGGSSSSQLSVPFGFDFDDIPPSSADAWNVLKDQAISDDENSSLALRDSHLVDPDVLLTDQWNFVMSEFIRDNAPQQINLCNNTALAITTEDARRGTDHSPAVLIDAKAEVMQLLEENAYSLFLRSQKHDTNTCECKGGCCYSVPAGTKRATVLRLVSMGEALDREICMNLPGPSSSEVCMNGRDLNASSPICRSTVALLPHSKFKSKFLAHLSSNSDTSSSGSSLSSFMHTLKGARVSSPVPHSVTNSVVNSARNSRAASPDLDSLRPASTLHDTNLSLMGKLWKKKK